MEENFVKYPIGLQDFEGLIKDGYVYVDKTKILYKLVNNGKYIFLSRPRRFGKSLILSTLKAYFEGKKELFRGLEIEELEKKWESRPVIHLSLAMYNPLQQGSLHNLLDYQFHTLEREWEIEERYADLNLRFAHIITEIYRKSNKSVVILIDEYDAPLLNTLHKTDLHEDNRSLLKSIYTNLKDNDRCIKFSMLTGVSRFSKMTVFSGLNNLNDITFDSPYAAICGFTEDEIKKYLWKGVEEFAKQTNSSPEKIMEILKREYDGYHFTEDLIDIYNPFSLLSCLSKCKTGNYWFNTGTPSFLAIKLVESSKPFSRIFESEADQISLEASDTAFKSPVALLFQTGYLTIKDYNKETECFTLGIPNKEVKESLFSSLLIYYSEEERMDVLKDLSGMRKSLEEGDPEIFLKRLQAFFTPISYRFQAKAPEKYFENNLYLILHALNLDVHSEADTSDGRIDILVKTSKFIYVMELKVDQPAENALRQIEEKEYDLPWRFDGREVFKIGISFSTEKRNIAEWVIKSQN